MEDDVVGEEVRGGAGEAQEDGLEGFGKVVVREVGVEHAELVDLEDVWQLALEGLLGERGPQGVAEGPAEVGKNKV